MPTSHHVRSGTVRAGFTLIEVLVVVAIIALLISILLPSLRLAREQAKTAVCLSNLKQQGNGFGTYSTDHGGTLPRAGAQFKYTIQEGVNGQGGNWMGVAGGALYGKYIGMTISLMYCPSNQDLNARSLSHKPPLTNEALFRHNYVNRKTTDPNYNSSNDTGYHVASNYAYALPALNGKYPRDRGKGLYEDVMDGMVTDSKGRTSYNESNYHKYMNDPADQSPAEAKAFLGTFPPGSRGRYSVVALSADGYFGGLRVGHPGGIDVLYSDFHAKRVADPKGKFTVKQATAGVNRYNLGDITNGGARGLIVWDYLSRNP